MLDELNGKKRINREHWQGYHPRVYNRISRLDADKLTEELCSRLQDVDVSACSLEMQIWWRDHQEADKAKAKSALSAAKKKAERKAALAKSTPHERKLLGL